MICKNQYLIIITSLSQTLFLLYSLSAHVIFAKPTSVASSFGKVLTIVYLLLKVRFKGEIWNILF